MNQYSQYYLKSFDSVQFNHKNDLNYFTSMLFYIYNYRFF